MKKEAALEATLGRVIVPYTPSKLEMPYNPVIDKIKGKAAKVSLVSYVLTRGILSRANSESELIGYCEEDPLKVFMLAFPKYFVTRLIGYELFNDSDVSSTVPLIGLDISPAPKKVPVYGLTAKINGKAKELFKLDNCLKAKREKPVSNSEIERIISNLKSDDYCDAFDARYDQEKQDTKIIMDAVKKFRK